VVCGRDCYKGLSARTPMDYLRRLHDGPTDVTAPHWAPARRPHSQDLLAGVLIAQQTEKQYPDRSLCPSRPGR